MSASSPLQVQREPSHRCGVTLMDNTLGHAVAAAKKGKPGVTVTYLPSMIRVDADNRVEFDFDELTEAVGEEFGVELGARIDHPGEPRAAARVTRAAARRIQGRSAS
jgi:MmoB/DmpM family